MRSEQTWKVLLWPFSLVSFPFPLPFYSAPLFPLRLLPPASQVWRVLDDVFSFHRLLFPMSRRVRRPSHGSAHLSHSLSSFSQFGRCRSTHRRGSPTRKKKEREKKKEAHQERKKKKSPHLPDETETVRLLCCPHLDEEKDHPHAYSSPTVQSIEPSWAATLSILEPRASDGFSTSLRLNLEPGQIILHLAPSCSSLPSAPSLPIVPPQLAHHLCSWKGSARQSLLFIVFEPRQLKHRPARCHQYSLSP
ncbi:hypothetical protein LZ30DRAFT_175888 [Colletotrichum cereale]|nr:hypothetical protein LZ30DRAFT_175888 [Colletotrichum cereale]